MKTDLKPIIIKKLEIRQYFKNELHREIGKPNKTNYENTIKELEKEGIIGRKRDEVDTRRIIIYLIDKNQKIMNFIKYFSNNLKTQKQLVNSYFNRLEERKHTWKVAEQTEIEEPRYIPKKTKVGKRFVMDLIPTKPVKRMKTSWKLDKKTIEHLDSILDIIDNMFTYSGSFTYILTLEILPKSYNSEIKNYQKLSIITIKDIVTKLERITKKSNYFIIQYIANRLMPYRIINQLEQISKKKPKIV